MQFFEKGEKEYNGVIDSILEDHRYQIKYQQDFPFDINVDIQW